jgi:hypothetical protein
MAARATFFNSSPVTGRSSPRCRDQTVAIKGVGLVETSAIFTLTILKKTNSYRGQEKPMKEQLKRASAGVSLVILSLGFSLLGILSFIQRLQGELPGASPIEQNYCLAGSAFSVFAGAIFLLSAFIYWRR